MVYKDSSTAFSATMYEWLQEGIFQCNIRESENKGCSHDNIYIGVRDQLRWGGGGGGGLIEVFCPNIFPGGPWLKNSLANWSEYALK